MSIHKECGENITWLKRDDDHNRFLPPMEYAGEVYVKDEDGAAKQVHAYRLHQCDPDKIIAWEDYRRRLAEATGQEYEPVDAARQRANEEAWSLALAVACRQCDMEPGVKCISQDRHLQLTGVMRETKNPHPIRLEEARAWKKVPDNG